MNLNVVEIDEHDEEENDATKTNEFKSCKEISLIDDSLLELPWLVNYNHAFSSNNRWENFRNQFQSTMKFSFLICNRGGKCWNHTVKKYSNITGWLEQLSSSV